MNESIRSYMKVGLIHFMAYPSVIKGEGPIEETFRKIALDDYFDVAEITWIKDPAGPEQGQEDDRHSHLEVAYGAQPRLAHHRSEHQRPERGRPAKSHRHLKEGIDEAYEMGALGFAFLSGKYRKTKKKKPFQALVKSTKELCAYAKSKGSMKVVLEVFDYRRRQGVPHRTGRPGQTLCAEEVTRSATTSV